MKMIISLVVLAMSFAVNNALAVTYINDAPGNNGMVYSLSKDGKNLSIKYLWSVNDTSTGGGRVKISNSTSKGEHLASGGETIVVEVGVLHDDTYSFETVVKEGGYGPIEVFVPNYACQSGKRETIIVDSHVKGKDNEKLLVALEAEKTFFFDKEDDGYTHTLMFDITCSEIITVIDDARAAGFETSLEYAKRKGFNMGKTVSRGDAMRGKK